MREAECECVCVCVWCVVRSTNLDKWTSDNILNMVAGGNAKAAAFFAKAGWSASNSNNTEKYTSKAANLYRVHLEKEKLKTMHMSTIQTLGVSPVIEPQASPTHAMQVLCLSLPNRVLWYGVLMVWGGLGLMV